MIIVITLLALVSTSLVPVITRPYVAENQVEAQNELFQIQAAVQQFISDVGAIPSGTSPLSLLTAANGLQLLLSHGSVSVASVGTTSSTPPDSGIVRGWNGPYLTPHYTNPLVDPWGNPYLIELNAVSNTQWRLRSWGPDRQTGTADDIVFPGDSANPAYNRSQGQLILDVWKTNGVLSWPVEANSRTSTWTVTISGATTACQSSGSITAGSTATMFTCPLVWFGPHHVRIVDSDALSTVLMAQDVVVNSPLTMAKGFITKDGLSGQASGFSNATTAGYSYQKETFQNWTLGTRTPATSAPTGTFAYLQMTADTLYSPPRYTVSGPAFVKISGRLTVPSGIVGECKVSFYLQPDATVNTWTAVPNPLFVQPPDNTVPVPFTAIGAVTLPATPPSWILYAVAEPVVALGGSACSGDAAPGSGGSASATLLTPPNFQY
jgi:type II secretory pathway pseudopilin PulG